MSLLSGRFLFPAKRLCVISQKLPAAQTLSTAVGINPSPAHTLPAVWTRSPRLGLGFNNSPVRTTTRKSLSSVWTPAGVLSVSGVRFLSGPGSGGGPGGGSDLSAGSHSALSDSEAAAAAAVGDGVSVGGGLGDAGVSIAGPGPGGIYSSLSDSAPVHLCEDFLLSFQQLSGLPWWLSIVGATLSVRTLVTLPLAAYQMVIIGKVEALQPEIKRLAQQLKYEVSVRGKERGWTETQHRIQFKRNLKRIVSQLYIRDNCHPFKASLLVWVQLPVWISLSLALRNLSLHPSDLSSGGVLWFPDLSVPDSSWILPVLLGVTNLIIIEVFSLQRVNPSRLQKVLTNCIRGFSVLMIPIAATVPSSMALYWFSSSLIGLTHNLLLRSPKLQKALQLQTQKSQTPYRDIIQAFRQKYIK